jgi:hypothetical protein
MAQSNHGGGGNPAAMKFFVRRTFPPVNRLLSFLHGN